MGLSIKENDTEIKYDDLMRYIHDQHPTKEIKVGNETKEVKYGLCDRVGRLPMPGMNICCCKGRCAGPDTSDMARDLGIGPALFLMFTKSMGWFFFFISIINLPVLYFFWVGNAEGAETAATTDMFARMTLGNIGQDSLTCAEKSYEDALDYYQNKGSKNPSQKWWNLDRTSLQSLKNQVNANFTLEMSCGTGVLGPVVQFGYQKTSNDTCNTVKQTESDPSQHFWRGCR
jgi:hypothetical protein